MRKLVGALVAACLVVPGVGVVHDLGLLPFVSDAQADARGSSLPTGHPPLNSAPSANSAASAVNISPVSAQLQNYLAELKQIAPNHPPVTGSASPATTELQKYLSELNMKSPHGKIQLAQANTSGKSDQTDDLLIEADKVLGKNGSKPKQDSTKQDSAKQDNKSEPEREVAEPDEKPSDYKKTASTDGKEKKTLTAAEEHLQLFVENKYPAAATCGICHPKHYKEWSVSQHAYAQLSPIYLSLNNKINELSNGSNGDFCLRCHSPVGANLGESTFESNLDRHPTSREGITCVVCHRIDRAYNKVSGRLALVEGGLTAPVFGPEGNAGVKDVLDKPEKFRVVTEEKEPGRKIHNKAKVFAPIKTSTFCGSCHDVTLFNGFRLEEAFSEYRLSPAAARGVTCQDCHMGKIEGKPSGYDEGPAAVIGDVPTKSRKLTRHLFSGPDYPIIHPGIFPHNQKAAEFKTMREWLQFKHKEGWGTDKFEDAIPAGYKFPKPWQSVDDRYDAREILKEQFELLEFAKRARLEVLRNGYKLDDVVVERADVGGLAFRVKVRNGTDGHNVPTGFTGERLVWLQVTVTDRDGNVVFLSGDRDANGDLRDGHSSYVHAGKAKLDSQLFSLQSIFVTQNGRGGEIEHVIPIPFPTFALPRVLPSTTSLVFSGEPATERNHKKGIEPNGHRWASYKVDGSKLTGNAPYKATVKLMAQAVPINLITSIQSVGFDFHMTPREVGDELIAGAQMLWKKEVTLGAEGVANSGSGPIQLAPAASFGAVVPGVNVTPGNAPAKPAPARRPRLADPVK